MKSSFDHNKEIISSYEKKYSRTKLELEKEYLKACNLGPEKIKRLTENATMQRDKRKNKKINDNNELTKKVPDKEQEDTNKLTNEEKILMSEDGLNEDLYF